MAHKKGRPKMKKLMLIVLLISTVVSRALSPRLKAAKEDMDASVLLHIKVNRHSKSGVTETLYMGCSGTFVTPYNILTAAHCFDGSKPRVWARGPNDVLGYPCHLVAWDKQKDLALLSVPFRHGYVKFGNTPKRFAKVLNIGSPYSFEFVPSEGVVGMVDCPLEPYSGRFIVTTAMVNPGSSGGGAFDEAGRLIGVNTIAIGFMGWQGITLAVDVPTIKKFLADALDGRPAYRGLVHGI